jgi:hypothetical protein
MLNLSGNEISDQGAQYLARILQQNQVKQILDLFISCQYFSFETDHHNLVSFLQ